MNDDAKKLYELFSNPNFQKHREEVQSEIIRTNGYDVRTHMKWMLGVVCLLTTRPLVEKYFAHCFMYSVAAQYLEDKELEQEALKYVQIINTQMVMFDYKTYYPMDLSQQNVTHCNNVIELVIPLLPKLSTENIFTMVFEDAEEIAARVSANSVMQGKKKPGFGFLFRPRQEMSPEVIRLNENFNAVKQALAHPARRFMRSESSKN